MKKCKECGIKIKPKRVFCSMACRTAAAVKLAGPNKNCKACGAEISPTRVFCDMSCREEYGAYLPSEEEIYREAARLRALRPHKSNEDHWEELPLEIKVISLFNFKH